MKERPILFSAPMVRAILAGTKTQTRRVCKPGARIEKMILDKYPYGQPGERLWVRETWAPCGKQSYPAADMVRHGDDGAIHRATWDRSPPSRWRPSIFMPRWASRITLEVTGVRMERVQRISHADAKAEGVYSEFMKKATRETIPPMTGPYDSPLSPKVAFRWLWDSLNAKRGFGWDKNPWVFAITFKRILP